MTPADHDIQALAQALDEALFLLEVALSGCGIPTPRVDKVLARHRVLVVRHSPKAHAGPTSTAPTEAPTVHKKGDSE
jgi:hypothetical protein